MSSKSAMAMRLSSIPKYLQETLTVANAKSVMDVRRNIYVCRKIGNMCCVGCVFRRACAKGMWEYVCVSADWRK